MGVDPVSQPYLPRLLAWVLCASPLSAALAGDPVVTDSRIITEERRLAILETKLASLQQQVRLLEDTKAIERLQQAYGHYVSAGLAQQAAALFADDPGASIEYAQQGAYVGRTRIAQFLSREGARLAPGEIRETPIMQGVVHVAADGLSAKGRWRSLVMGGLHGQDGRWTEGPYENEYVKEDGVWRIRKLHWYTTVSGSYDKGWHKQAYPANSVLTDLPPDRPPSQVYKSWPDFFLPPYHYTNPITGKPVNWDY
jgi:hypothetical protein